MINLYKHKKTLKLNKNYLDFVGVALQYSNIPDFDEIEREFFSNIKQILPFRKAIPIQQFQFQVTQKSFQSTQNNVMQYVYEDTLDNTTIRLVASKNFLDFQCPPLKEKYEGFEVFLKKIIAVLKEFFKVYSSKINLNSLILRKINKLNYDEHKDIIGTDLLCEQKLFDNQIKQSFKEIVLTTENNQIIEIRNGILPDPNYENRSIIFDYTIKINNSGLLQNDSNYIKEQLTQYNLTAFNIFVQTIGKKFFKELQEPKK